MRTLLANLDDSGHQAAIISLLDMYCRDEFGASRPLPEYSRQNLIAGLKRHGGAKVFLTYDGEVAIGLALCFLGFSSFRAKPLLNVHDIAVSPEYRGRGVGRSLLDAAADEARRLGCCKLTLEVRADNHRAKELYRRVGFRPSEPEETLFWSMPLE